MDARRQIVTFVFMFGFIVLWMNVAPRLFPQFFPKPQPKPNVAQPADPDAGPRPVGDAGINGDDQNIEGNEPAIAGDPDDATVAGPDAPAPAEAPQTAKLPEFLAREIPLGDAKAGFLQELMLTTRGAAIEWQRLTEKDYVEVDRSGPLKLLGNGEPTTLRTLAVSTTAFDDGLEQAGKSLASVDWEFVEKSSERIPDSDAWQKVVFRYPSPNGQWEAIKTFAVKSGQEIDPETDPQGYLVDVTLTFRNLGDQPATLTYDLQGPVGLPIDFPETDRYFREVEAGTLEDPSDPDDVSHVQYTAAGLVSEVADAKEKQALPPSWTYPVKWAGVDVQFFATLLIPAENQLEDRNGDGKPDAYFKAVQPTVVAETAESQHSDISLLFRSNPVQVGVGANNEVTHTFQIFLGPKRAKLLKTFEAEDVISFGWFSFISKLMLGLLNFFHHSLLLPYGIAIILLTVVVQA
ncbi:MAG: YidC/Oxa1 family insertase periplasmic-domain containing protein [Planctomycetaceae bacterium]